MFWETKKEYLGIHAPFIPVEDIVADTVRYLRDYISYIPFEVPVLLFLNIKLKNAARNLHERNTFDLCGNVFLGIARPISARGAGAYVRKAGRLDNREFHQERTD